MEILLIYYHIIVFHYHMALLFSHSIFVFLYQLRTFLFSTLFLRSVSSQLYYTKVNKSQVFT